MPLKPATIDVPLIGGVETKADRKVVPPTKLLTLENGRFVTPGQISKRYGYDKKDYSLIDGAGKKITAANLFTSGKQLFIHGNKTLTDGTLGNDDGWKMFAADGNTEKLHDIGFAFAAKLGVETATLSHRDTKETDIAVCNGYTIVVAAINGDTSDDGVICTVIDNTNETVVINNYYLAPGKIDCLHAVALGTAVHVYGRVNGGANNYLYRGIIDTTDLSTPNTWVMGSLGQISTDLSICFDTAWANHPTYGDCAVVAYPALTTDYLYIAWYDAAGTLRANNNTTTVIQDRVGSARVFDKDTSSYRVAVCYRKTDDSYEMTLLNENATVYGTRTITTALAGKTVRNVTVIEDPPANLTANQSSMRVFIDVKVYPVPELYSYIHTSVVRFATDVHTDGVPIKNCLLASKAFRVNVRARVWVSGQTNLQRCQFLRSVRNTTVSPADDDVNLDAKALYNRAMGSVDVKSLSNVIESSSGVWKHAALRRDRLLSDGAANISSAIVTLDTTETKKHAVDAFGSMICSGPVVGHLGSSYVDHGFQVFHEQAVANSYSTGGTLSDGTYYYHIVYEWMDSKGQLHRSYPNGDVDGMPITITLSYGTSTQRVEITVPCLYIGEYDKLRKTIIALYRDDSNGIFHRVAETKNDLTSDNVVFDDTVSEADAADNEELYTTGGVIGNICPPASSLVAVGNGRVWLVPDEDPENLWFSKLKSPGIAAEFSDLFTKRIPTGGHTKAIGFMGGNTIIFKSDQIRAFGGLGPNDLGQGTFTEDRIVTHDVGTTEPQSLVYTKLGLLFKSTKGSKSEKGFYLLSRAYSAEYIGAPVDAWNQYDVLRGKLLEDQHEVRYLLSNGDCLSYDYLANQWSVFTNHVGVDGALWDRKFAFLKSDGTLRVESNGFKDDDDGVASNPITLKLSTAWIKLAGLQGYQRVWWIYLLGEYLSAHDLKVELAYDYDDAVEETFTLTGSDPMQWRIKPGRQRCKAIKITVYDTNQSGSGESFSLTGFTFKVGLGPGAVKLKPSKSL